VVHSWFASTPVRTDVPAIRDRIDVASYSHFRPEMCGWTLQRNFPKYAAKMSKDSEADGLGTAFKKSGFRVPDWLTQVSNRQRGSECSK